jgi:uncharacterized protein YpbB
MTDDFLITLFSATEPRRNRVIFGLLKNTTTVSTLYWGLRYQLLAIVGLLPNLTMAAFDKRLNKLVTDGLLVAVEDGIYVLSSAGLEAQATFAERHYLPQHLDAMQQFDVPAFMQGFLLANQVVSEAAYNNRRYYPLQIDAKIMLTVKQWFINMNSPRLTESWVMHIQRFLQKLPQVDADRLAASWIGHQTPGQNFNQLGFPKSWTNEDYYFWQMDQYALWSETLQRGVNSPLKLLWVALKDKSVIPPSAQASLTGVISNRPMDEMVKSRRLKIGTIREHLLTAAIWLPISDFPYQKFLTPEVVSYMQTRLAGDIDSWDFKAVENTGDPEEFFLFRMYEIYQTKREAAQHG